MSAIKVGDRVRIVNVPHGSSPLWGKAGDIGTVQFLHGDSATVLIDGAPIASANHMVSALESLPTKPVVPTRFADADLSTWCQRYEGEPDGVPCPSP